MNEKWPQIVLALMFASEFGIFLVKDGEKRENYSLAWWLLSAAITIFLLYEGGFW